MPLFVMLADNGYILMMCQEDHMQRYSKKIERGEKERVSEIEKKWQARDRYGESMNNETQRGREREIVRKIV